jgi:glutaredoxin 2
MAVCRPTYPRNSLDAIKKGTRLQKELSDAILHVLQTDKQVQDLIKKKAQTKTPYSLDVVRVLDDPQVQQLLQAKTHAKYEELVRRSR